MQAHLGALLLILAEAVIQCNPSDCISSTDLHNRAWGIKLRGRQCLLWHGPSLGMLCQRARCLGPSAWPRRVKIWDVEEAVMGV